MEPVTINDNSCFCCGTNNDHGLKMKFQYPEEGTAVSDLTIPEHFTGWKDVVHGGFLSMVLDEIMAHACISAGAMGVTAEMTVRFKKPASVGDAIRISGEIAENKGRIFLTRGTVSSAADGTVFAEATAKFIKMSSRDPVA